MTPDPIPKFLSFKPKARPQESTSTESSNPEREHKRRRHSREFEEGRRKPSHDFARDKRRRSPPATRASDETSPFDQPVASEARSFTIDTVGDSNNLKYGTLHKYDIADYHRKGYGNIIGLRKQLKIDRDQSTLTQIVLDTTHVHGERDQRGLLRAKNSTKFPVKFLRSDPSATPFPSRDDFVPLSKARKRTREAHDAASDQDGLNFRQLESKPATTDDTNSESELSEDDNVLDLGAAARRKNGELNRLARDDPANAVVWMDLIYHQSELVAPGVETKSLTTTQRRAVADLRLDLYRKAMQNVQGSDRRGLVKSMLDEGSLMWDFTTLMMKYEDSILEEPSNTSLWREYIDLMQNPEREFIWGQVKDRFLECLTLLQTTRQTTVDAALTADLQLAQIYVILRLTKLMHNMGYEELSIAIWQALMSVHMLGSNQPEQFEALKDKWDNEEPRFGETASNATTIPPHNTESRKGCKFSRFASNESRLSQSREMPGKTDEEPDETMVEDVFHVVFFADIADVLERTTLPLDREALIDAFLAFFELPPVPASMCKTRPWRNDPALDSPAMEENGAPDESTVMKPHSFAFTTDTIWHGGLFPKSITQRHGITEFINESLAQLAQAERQSSHLSRYWLAFQAKYFPELAPKTAKRLLKSRPSELALYNTAGRIEAQLGRNEKARLIYNAALQQSTIQNVENAVDTRSRKVDLLRLAHSWALLELHLGDEKQATSSLFALHRSSSSSTQPDITTAARLSLNEDLKTGFTVSIHHADPDTAGLFSSARLLLAYLTTSDSLSAALATHQSHRDLLTTLNAPAPISEAVHQSLYPIVTHHLDLHRPHRLADLLKVINAGLALHPENTLLLSLQQRLTGPLSAIDATMRASIALDGQSGLAVWLAALQRQIARAPIVGPEATRSLFRRATEQGSGVRHAPAVWWLWLRFEESRSLDAARRVWAAGCLAMAWSKAWLLEGMKMFDCPGGMSERELMGVYDRMLETGMRIRVELEE